MAPRKPRSGVVGDPTEQLRAAGIDMNMFAALQGQSDLLEVKVADKDIHIEIKGLPSGGRFYKNNMGMPIKIKGMPLKVIDAIGLESARIGEDQDIMDDVIARRVIGVSPEDMLEMDRKYVIAWLREQSFQKAPLRRTFQCQECNHVNSLREISLSDFLIYNLPDGATPPEFDLPERQERIKLRFERRKDQKRVEDYIRKFSSLRTVEESEIKLYRIASVIEGMSMDTAMELINDLSLIDFAVLNTKFEECNMGFSNIAFVKCEQEECGYANPIHIPFRDHYFIPRIGPDLVDKG